MDYSAIINIHTFIGFSALGSFWVAALSRKGSYVHRTAGKVFMLSMLVILASVIPMIIVKANEGDIVFCIILGYLFSIAAVATYVTWFAIQKKKAREDYHSSVFKIIATILFFYGYGICIIGINNGSLLQIVFSSVGLVLGASMWWSVWSKTVPKNWYLAQHLNGVAVNFAAVHGSFFRFGLAGLLPIPDSPELNTFAQTSMIVLALVLRLWLGKKFLKRRNSNELLNAPV
jgi:uncharacterized membrane protein